MITDHRNMVYYNKGHIKIVHKSYCTNKMDDTMIFLPNTFFLEKLNYMSFLCDLCKLF